MKQFGVKVFSLIFLTFIKQSAWNILKSVCIGSTQVLYDYEYVKQIFPQRKYCM